MLPIESPFPVGAFDKTPPLNINIGKLYTKWQNISPIRITAADQ